MARKKSVPSETKTVLTQEEVVRDRAELVALLASVAALPHDSRLYLLGFASALIGGAPVLASG